MLFPKILPHLEKLERAIHFSLDRRVVLQLLLDSFKESLFILGVIY